MGSSSKSSTSTSSKTTNVQETQQRSSEGVVGGDVIQGTEIAINNAFPEEVANAFTDLISLSKTSLDAATSAGGFAIDAVSQRRQTQENPSLTVLDKTLPLVGIAIAGVIFYFMIKGAR